MNSVRLYWLSRLNDEQVFYNVATADVDYRGDRHWPEFAARGSLYQDYLFWYGREYVPMFRQILPPPPRSLDDFMRGFYGLILRKGYRMSASGFPVKVPRHYEGRWYTETVDRKFIRIPPLDEALEIFREKQLTPSPI